TFTVTLPSSRRSDLESEPEASRSASAQKIPEIPLIGLRILVVDDDSDTCDFLAAALQHSGAKVLAASSAKEALHIFQRDHPDILISDIAMPHEDGYALIKKIRELNDEFARIPAIALTAYARPEDRARALAAGFQEYMAKPVAPVRLEKGIFNLITEDRIRRTG